MSIEDAPSPLPFEKYFKAAREPIKPGCLCGEHYHIQECQEARGVGHFGYQKAVLEWWIRNFEAVRIFGFPIEASRPRPVLDPLMPYLQAASE